MTTVSEIFAGMPAKLNKDAAAGVDAVYQYDITGEDGGKWHTHIKDGEITISEGEHEKPNITLTVSAEDYIDMAEGRLNGQAAFMTGKLKIKGDMGLAMKLTSLFD